MPKDFVFVDLSPVKSEGESDSSPSSPTFSETSDDSLMTNDSCFSDLSFNSLIGDEFTSFDGSFDFGIMLDKEYIVDHVTDGHLQQTMPQAIPQSLPVQQSTPIQTPQTPSTTFPAFTSIPNTFTTPPTMPQLTQAPEMKRSKSVDAKKPLQFKTYTPKPKKVKKPTLKHRHTISEPIARKDLDDFMSLNNQIQVDLSRDYDELSNSSSISDDEFLQQPLNSNLNGDIDCFLNLKQEEFDLSAFVSF